MIPYRDDNPLSRFPIVTVSLILANVAVFALTAFSRNAQAIVNEYGYIPAAASMPDLMTSMFLHGGIGHLIGNMLYLWLFGDNVEDRLGRGVFAVFYLGSGVVADLLHGTFTHNPEIPTVGASGAIAGVMGCYLVLFPWADINCFTMFLFRVYVFKIPALFLMGFWFILQFVGLKTESNVAYWAHIGGFVLGAGVGTLLRIGAKRSKPESLPANRVPHFKPSLTTLRQERTRQAAFLVAHNLSHGSPAEAAKQYARFERRYPALPLEESIQWQIAYILEEQLQETLALEAYKKYVTHYPDGYHAAPARFKVGLLNHRRKNYPEAKNAYEALLRAFPGATESTLARRELAKIESELTRTGLEEVPSTVEGNYYVVRQTSERLSVPVVAKIVAKCLGISSGDAAMLVAKSRRLLMSGLSRHQAEEAVQSLQSAGIPVLAISENRVVNYPSPVSAEDFVETRTGFMIKTPVEIGMEWEDVGFVLCGRLASTGNVRVDPGAGFALGRVLTKKYHHPYNPIPESEELSVKMPSLTPVVDLISKDFLKHIRFLKGRLKTVRLRPGSAEPEAVENFATFTKRLAESASLARFGEGIDRLFSEESLSIVTFDSLAEYEKYVFWQVQLLSERRND